MARHGHRVLPVEIVTVPGHGVEIFVRASKKIYVQTSSLNEALGNSLLLTLLCFVFSLVTRTIRCNNCKILYTVCC